MKLEEGLNQLADHGDSGSHKSAEKELQSLQDLSHFGLIKFLLRQGLALRGKSNEDTT